jgi:N,N'-diacetyllegionaminate synthase
MENKVKTQPVVIIAEAGVNHNGDIEIAKKMIQCAKESGADIVKFQTFKSKDLSTKTAEMAKYQIENSKKKESQLQMLEKLELSFDEFKELHTYAKKVGIRFLSTAFDLDSLDFLKTLNMGIWKIPSGEITNLPYLEMLAKQFDPVIISTGMCDMEEVEAAVQVFNGHGYDLSNLTILHCNTDYPTRFEDVHLRAMKTIQDRFNLDVGYSDHTLGIEVSIAAVALGAKVIEKHFTLDRKMEGPDHKASLEPEELRQMVESIRHISVSLGRTVKEPTERELLNRRIARKSIVAQTDISKGDIFTDKNLTTKRPGQGISPMRWHDYLGRIADRNYKQDDLIC